jgi:PST family polysaccharide transporter
MAKLMLNMVSTMFLARLLTPDDFGLIAMGAFITGYIAIFRDLGLSSATVQQLHLDHRQISALFWINGGVGLLLSAICAAAGPVAAWFYGDERLINIALISSLGFVFGGFTVQKKSLLSRSMNFFSLAVIDVCSMAIGAGVGILLAFNGVGYLSLVWMSVSTAAVSCATVWCIGDWRPSMRVKGAKINGMLRYGLDLSGFSVINYCARNLDNLLIGKFWGAEQLGIYAKAYNLLIMPIQQINNPIRSVAFPVLCSLQTQPARFRRYYLNILFFITALTTPLCLCLAVIAPEVVDLILGPQWDEVAIIFRLLAISAVAQPVCNTSGWLYTATGNSRGLFKWGSMGSLGLIISFFVGLPYGPKGVAVAYSIAVALWMLPCMYLAITGTSISIFDVVKVIGQPLIASAPGIAWLIIIRIAGANSVPIWLWLPGGLVGMAIFYWLVLFKVFGKGPLFLDVLQQIRPQNCLIRS